MSFANDDVLKFYKELPFNIFGSKEEHQKFIKSGVSLNSHPGLTEILSKQKSVLEVGCGVGRFSAQIADRFKSSVTAIDFNPVVIDYAQTAANALGLNVSYEAADLFKFDPKEKFDICVSLGVLHHTNNCIAAVQRCIENYVKYGDIFMLACITFTVEDHFLNILKNLLQLAHPKMICSKSMHALIMEKLT